MFIVWCRNVFKEFLKIIFVGYIIYNEKRNICNVCIYIKYVLMIFCGD